MHQLSCLGRGFFLAAVLLGWGAVAPPAQAQSWGRVPVRAASQSATGETPVTRPAAELTDADRIARLQRGIDENGKQIAELKRRLEDPKSEYALSEAEFSALDKEHEAKRAALAEAQQRSDATAITSLEKQISDLAPKRQLARERFDLAIKERKAVQEQITALEAKLQGDTAALLKLKGEAPPASQPSVKPADTAAQPAPAQQTGQPPKSEPQPTPAGQPQATPPTGEQGAAPATPPGAPPAVTEKPPSEELIKAREAAAQKEEAALAAEEEVKSVTDRIQALQKSIDGELKLYETSRKRVAIAKETERTLYENQQRKWAEGAAQGELSAIAGEIREARQRLRDAEKERDERSDRIDRLQAELVALQNEQIEAARVAEARREEADKAQKDVEHLQNPWTLTNTLNWIIAHGPRIVGIIVGTFCLLWLVRVAQGRIVRLLAGRVDHGSHADRQNRAQTLVGVFRSAAVVAIYGGAAMMLLAEFNVNIVPLLGGAAVLGLAVAFGAQNLIRDYFYGFMILLENQYAVNDVVKIGDVSGQVERITLRITVLRGLDGTVHFVPNGEINRVSNMTHGWSRALFEIGVAYKENVDRVMEVLMELAKELRRDPNYRSLILEMPEMLGVDQFADSAVVIKFFIKTRPLQQWAVKRELLRRIKFKFDELGIEIPFPHRTVFHRYEDGDGASPNHASAMVELAPGAREEKPRSPGAPAAGHYTAGARR